MKKLVTLFALLLVALMPPTAQGKVGRKKPKGPKLFDSDGCTCVDEATDWSCDLPRNATVSISTTYDRT